MARSVKAHEHAEKRNAILDVAQRYITTKGYEQMTTQDILEELQISRGAFYHYFDSKAALLLALVERNSGEIERLVLPIIHDTRLAALDKLPRFFAAFSHWKLAHKSLLFGFIRVWYGDENALVRHKIYNSRVNWLAPWLAEIIEQGIAEGVFTTAYPDQAARMIFSLLEDLGYAMVGFLLPGEHGQLDIPRLERILGATVEAMERILGMPASGLQLTWYNEFLQWLDLSSEEQEPAQALQPES